MRTRKQLVRERAQHVQQIQKTLEDANLKKVLQVTTGRLRADRYKLIEALRGRVRPHHRFLFKPHLGQIEALEKAIDELVPAAAKSTAVVGSLRMAGIVVGGGRSESDAVHGRRLPSNVFDAGSAQRVDIIVGRLLCIPS
jgi:transposase